MEQEATIFSLIFEKTDFSESEKVNILSRIKKIVVKKGAFILHAGETTHFQYFVSEGCLRTYYLDSNGKEHTLQFAIKNWWISDYTAFFSTSTAIMHIECIQNATLYRISKTDMEALYLEVPKLESFFRRKMEKAFESFQKRILASLSKPAIERYENFILTYPNIEKSVKNYHIASYLGITTESLSRIRKELAEK